MNPDFWLARWSENRIGFHQTEVNPFLREHIDELNVSEGERILVPLCGKSLDMLWLAEQRRPVLGIEVSVIAVEAFFEENGLDVTRSQEGAFIRYSSGPIEILCGDFFKVKKEAVGMIDGVYDRAALIALPKEMRGRYTDRIASWLPAGGRILLISIEYPQDEMSGPPFSVDEAEVRGLFGEKFDTALLAVDDVLERDLRFKERGVTRLEEKLYLLVKKE